MFYQSESGKELSEKSLEVRIKMFLETLQEKWIEFNIDNWNSFQYQIQFKIYFLSQNLYTSIFIEAFRTHFHPSNEIFFFVFIFFVGLC